MSIKSERVKGLMFGKGSAVFEAYMAGRYLQSRVSSMGRARIATEPSMRTFWVKMAREDHRKFLNSVAKIQQLERV